MILEGLLRWIGAFSIGKNCGRLEAADPNARIVLDAAARTTRSTVRYLAASVADPLDAEAGDRDARDGTMPIPFRAIGQLNVGSGSHLALAGHD